MTSSHWERDSLLLLLSMQGTAPVHSEKATFFEINSPYFMVTMTAVGSLLFCAIVCGLTYDILRRMKEKKQGKLGRNIAERNIHCFCSKLVNWRMYHFSEYTEKFRHFEYY